MRCYKVPYGVPNACIVWISLKTLCSPVLASFADSKLLDFARASNSMTYRTLCAARYTCIQYMHLLTLGARALSMVAKIVDPGFRRPAFLAQSTGKLSTIVG